MATTLNHCRAESTGLHDSHTRAQLQMQRQAARNKTSARMPGINLLKDASTDRLYTRRYQCNGWW